MKNLIKSLDGFNIGKVCFAFEIKLEIIQITMKFITLITGGTRWVAVCNVKEPTSHINAFL